MSATFVLNERARKHLFGMVELFGSDFFNKPIEIAINGVKFDSWVIGIETNYIGIEGREITIETKHLDPRGNLASVKFIECDRDVADNEFAVKIGRHFVADIYPPKSRKKRGAIFERSINHRFSADELRAIADKLDELERAGQ